MTRTTVFQSNRSQAVRLPKDVAFPADMREVAILRDGADRVMFRPTGPATIFFAASGNRPR